MLKTALHRALVLVGLRRTANSVPLFTTWHSYAAVFTAAVVIAGLSHLG